MAGRYSDAFGRQLNRHDLSLKTSGAEGASVTGSPMELGDASVMTLAADVTAASGTSPTLVVVIEGSDDGITWHELGRIGSDGYRAGSVGTAPANFTTTGKVWATLPATRFVRYRSVIGGTTPSFTFSVAGSYA
jgi:hypothetical protein